jgi:hypothetical protein
MMEDSVLPLLPFDIFLQGQGVMHVTVGGSTLFTLLLHPFRLLRCFFLVKNTGILI